MSETSKKKATSVGAGRFVDAVLMARDLITNNIHLLSGEVINVNPDLVEIVSKRVNLDFQILKIEAETTRIAGLTINYKELRPENSILNTEITPQILVSATNSHCWNRFTVCKELLYYYIGEKAKTPEKGLVGEDLIEKLESIKGDFCDIKKEDDLDTEHFTFVMAIELLLPWERRDDLHKQKETGLTNHQIALNFSVPESIISLYFDCYKKLSAECNGALQ